MAKKREVKINASVSKVVVFTNDKGNEFVQLIVNVGGRDFYICDFKQNDALLCKIYKAEMENDKK